MNWRKIRRWISVLICLGLVVFYLGVRHVGNMLLAPTNHPVGLPPNDLPIIATTIPSESGTTLATWYIPAADSHATIVLLHGIRADRRSMLGRARLFRKAGYAVLMIDMQAHGESPGENITVGYLEKHDVRAAVKFAREKNPGHRIAVVGQSLGAAAAILASPLDIDAVVLESAFPTIADAVHNRISRRLGPLSYIISPILIKDVELRSGISSTEIAPIDHIAQLGCPVLIASGESDDHTTIADAQNLFTAAREPKQLAIFPAAAHVDLLAHDPETYEREVLPFLNHHLSRP
jgi:fermentation-respiration switch protein FrsA (DUF1100 family)